MERRRSKPIGELLGNWLQQEGLATPLAEYRALRSWPEVSGAEAFTREVRIYNQTFFVTLTSAAARANLSLRKTALIRALNAAAGAHVVADIVLR